VETILGWRSLICHIGKTRGLLIMSQMLQPYHAAWLLQYTSIFGCYTQSVLNSTLS